MNRTPWQRSLGRLISVLGVGVWGWVLTGPAHVQAEAGALTQLAGIEGCVSNDGSGGDCADGSGLLGAASVAESPDGKYVYVASDISDAIVVFERDKSSGVLTQLIGTDGCVSGLGIIEGCADGKALGGASSVAVSPDGKYVYVASFESDAVAVFMRDSCSGALTQLARTAGCVSEDGSGGACADGHGLDSAFAVAVSDDGEHVYVGSDSVGSGSGAVAVFARDKISGALTQLAGTTGCVSEDGGEGTCADGKGLLGIRTVTVSPGGKHVYVASFESDAVAVFARDKSSGALTQLAGAAGCVSEDGSGGTCTDGTGLLGARSATVSNDGKHVYVASFDSSGVMVFARNKNSGALTQLAGCVSFDGTGGACADGTGLDGANSVTVSDDGEHVYATSGLSDAVTVFARDKSSGALTQLAGTEGCVSEDGTGGTSGGVCTDGKGLDGANSVTVSKNGKHVYVASFSSSAVAVRSSSHEATTLPRRHTSATSPRLMSYW